MKLHEKFRNRIPRKLKKAAKNGINHCVKSRFTNSDGKYNVQEIHFWTITGRRTKWKLRAIYKCVAEYKRMAKEQTESWLIHKKDEEEVLAFLQEKEKYLQQCKISEIPCSPPKFHIEFTKGGGR